jgi:selenocysteine lyase/cysteine desulfurase
MPTTEILETSALQRLREEFPVTRRWAYMNHAGIGPLPRRAAERAAAVAAGTADGGDRLWAERNAGCERTRALAARLLGARDPHEVAFVENTSSGLSLVAQGLPWEAGDNVVGAACEFPSNVYPWTQLGERGVEYRPIPERDGRVEEDEVLAAVDGRTRVVALSWVEYSNGCRFDLARIAAACRERGALFVVDAIQGLGALALDVEREGVDVCAAAAHKWLLGPEGTALLYVSDRVIERIRPARSGWRSMRHKYDWTRLEIDWAEGAKRYECGTLNALGIHALGESLGLLLDLEPRQVEQRVLALAGRAAEGLARLGFQPIGSRPPASGIVTAVHPGRAAEELVEALAARGVVVAARAGRLRVSAHVYNSEEEVDRLLVELAGLV